MSDVGLVLTVILVLAIVWRGPRTLPLIGRMLGRGVKAARDEAKAVRGDDPPRAADDKPAAPGT